MLRTKLLAEAALERAESHVIVSVSIHDEFGGELSHPSSAIVEKDGARPNDTDHERQATGFSKVHGGSKGDTRALLSFVEAGQWCREWFRLGGGVRCVMTRRHCRREKGSRLCCGSSSR